MLLESNVSCAIWWNWKKCHESPSEKVWFFCLSKLQRLLANSLNSPLKITLFQAACNSQSRNINFTVWKILIYDLLSQFFKKIILSPSSKNLRLSTYFGEREKLERERIQRAKKKKAARDCPEITFMLLKIKEIYEKKQCDEKNKPEWSKCAVLCWYTWLRYRLANICWANQLEFYLFYIFILSFWVLDPEPDVAIPGPSISTMKEGFKWIMAKVVVII